MKKLTDIQVNQHYDLRNAILGSLDFEKIHAYMVLTNWTWRGEPKPPTIGELEGTVAQIVRLCYEAHVENKEHYSASQGGFTAILQYGQITVHFSIERKGVTLPEKIKLTNDPTITIKEKDLTLSQRLRSGV